MGNAGAATALSAIRMGSSTRVLVISHDVVGKYMAGPGIRFYHCARVLGSKFQVTLAAPQAAPQELAASEFRFIPYHRREWETLAPAVANTDVIVCPSDIANDFPELGSVGVPLVIDGYDPLWAEWLSLSASNRSVQENGWQSRLGELERQYLIGDFFVCASERQRDWWLGLLELSGRINPYTFREDASLRRLIDVVPYGLPEDPPRATCRMVKGVWKGIAADDKVILWGGGLWPWLDPLTAISAFAEVHAQQPRTRLIFPGTRHPNPKMEMMPTHNAAARSLAQDLGLLDRAIFFGDWVPYADWQNVLLESDLAITFHGAETFESRLAFRSRVFEFIWAGLPVVATRGDATSDLIAQGNLGIVVPNGDIPAATRAMLQLLAAPAEYRERIEQAKAALTWEHAVSPLVRFCLAPRRAPDKVALGERLGNPFYLTQMERTRTENTRLGNLVNEYSQRRAVRWANRLPRITGRRG